MITHKFLNTKMKNIFTNVFLGRKIKVINSCDISKIGINGIIINETKNMFQIKDLKDNMKNIPKKECIFDIEINNNFERIDGKNICYNLAERIKKFS